MTVGASWFSSTFTTAKPSCHSDLYLVSWLLLMRLPKSLALSSSLGGLQFLLGTRVKVLVA